MSPHAAPQGPRRLATAHLTSGTGARIVLGGQICAAAALLLSGSAAFAKPPAAREGLPAPAWSQRMPQPWLRSRGPDLYSREPGTQGTITATTPNQWGNFGGPGTGGGGGGGP
jgi:hypothetical protein